MSAATYRETAINGYDAKLWDHSDSAPVRAFCAAVGRDNQAIKRLTTSVVHDVSVWVRIEPECENTANIPTPDGFEVAVVRSTSSGGVNVEYDRVEQ